MPAMVVLLWLAWSGAAAPAASGDLPAYRSPSGEFELTVDRLRRDGHGPATYRMRRGGADFWERERPFTLLQAVVANDGSVGGSGYAEGDPLLGDLAIAVLDPLGGVRAEHRIARTWRHDALCFRPPMPNFRGLIHDPRSRTFTVRVGSGSGGESWWRYSLDTGEKLGEFRPEQRLPPQHPGPWRAVEELRPLPGLDLTLVRWRTEGGAEFSLMDGTCAELWCLSLPRCFAEPDPRAGRALELRVEQHGALLAAEDDGSFAVWCAADGMRADFLAERSRSAPTGWRVMELGRRAYRPPEPPPPLPPPPVLQLERLGSIELLPEPLAAPQFQEPCDWFAAADGSIELIDRVGPRDFVWRRYDANGATAMRALPPFPGQGRGEIRWARAGERSWLAAWRAEGGALRFFRADAAAGTLAEIEGVDASTAEGAVPSVEALAACADGGFAAILQHSLRSTRTRTLAVFDASGATRCSLREGGEDPARLLGPVDLAVLSTGAIAVLEPAAGRLRQFAPSGELLAAFDLAESLGQQANAASRVEAGPSGDVLIHVLHGDRPLFRLDASGTVRARVAPRLARRRAPESLAQNARLGADGAIWTADDRCFYRIDGVGLAVPAFSAIPESEFLEEVACATFDGFGRALVRDAESGAVHVFGGDGERQCIVASDLPELPYSSVERRMAGFGDGELLIWSGSRNVYVRCDSVGSELGVLALDAPVVPPRDGAHLWSLGPGQDLELRTREGELVQIVQRRAGGGWLEVPSAAAAEGAGGLLAYSDGALVSIDASGIAGAEIAVPGDQLTRHGLAASPSFAVLFEGGSDSLLVDRRNGAIHRWRPLDTRTDCEWALDFSPDGRELWVLRWPRLTLERYALP